MENLFFIYCIDFILVIWIASSLFRRILFTSRTHCFFSVDLVWGMLFISQIIPLVLSDFSKNWEEGWLCDPNIRYEASLLSSKYLFRAIIASTFLLLGLFGKSKKLKKNILEANQQWGLHRDFFLKMVPNDKAAILERFCWFFLFLPWLIICFSPTFLDYFVTWGTPEARGFSVASLRFFTLFVAPACLLAVLCYGIIIWCEVQKNRRLFCLPIILSTLLAVAACFIQGKRSLLFFVLILLTLYIYQETKKKRIVFFVIIWFVFLVFMVQYMVFGKGFDASHKSNLGDFFRDYTVRPVLTGAHWTSHDAMDRGDGLVFQLLFFLPREYWPDKPWPTPRYLTKWIIGTKDYLGWGFGVGFIEDGLGNFGYLGWFFYTLLIAMVCRVIDWMVYRKSSIYLILELVLIYSTVFAFSVVIRLLLILIPILFLMHHLSDKRNWSIAEEKCEEIY